MRILIALLVGSIVCACSEGRTDEKQQPRKNEPSGNVVKPKPVPVLVDQLNYRALLKSELSAIPAASGQLVRLGYRIRLGKRARLLLRLEDRGRPIISMSSLVPANRQKLVLLSITRTGAAVILSDFEDLVGPKAKPIVAQLKKDLPDLLHRSRGRFWSTLGAGVASGGIPTRLMPGPKLSGQSGGIQGTRNWSIKKRLNLHYWLWFDAAHQGTSVAFGPGFFNIKRQGKPVDKTLWKWPIWHLYLEVKPL